MRVLSISHCYKMKIFYKIFNISTIVEFLFCLHVHTIMNATVIIKPHIVMDHWVVQDLSGQVITLAVLRKTLILFDLI